MSVVLAMCLSRPRGWFKLVQGSSCFQGEHVPKCSFTDRKMPNLALLSLKAAGHCH